METGLRPVITRANGRVEKETQKCCTKWNKKKKKKEEKRYECVARCTRETYIEKIWVVFARH